MNKVKTLLIIPIAMLLSACVGEEPNDIAYVTALGIDKAENNFEYTLNLILICHMELYYTFRIFEHNP